VDGIGKRYRLGEHTSFGSLRESLMTRLRSFGRHRGDDHAASIWALRDISFEVAQGEAIGIIGRNGAGKSTLLKVLSRITEPTTGRAEIRGRVGSLLEVGTGFHPELTGRENIYLNGAILGMTRNEIRKRFDEIVAFSGVERFLDTPVKRYSSGMQIRLAFSVAAHLEPDILLVDEVLAVGDLEFQRKCLGRMSEVATSGRTVLFVSHNLAAVKRLCGRAILLRNGSVAQEGLVDRVVAAYAEGSADGDVGQGHARSEFPEAPDAKMQIRAIEAVDSRGSVLAAEIESSHAFGVRIEYTVREPIESAYIMCAITDPTGLDVVWTYDGDSEHFGNRQTGTFQALVMMPAQLLVPGRYSLRAAVVDTNLGTVHYPGLGPSFMVTDTHSLLAHRGIPWPGVVRLNPEWRTERLE
jgi:lipopolysaccharide transport system ATP-binding protein